MDACTRLCLLAKEMPAPSKESVERWKQRSPGFRKDYIKQHPNTIFKDIRVNSPSERISKDEHNKSVAATATDTLKALGFRAKTKISATGAHLQEFMNSKNRHLFADKGTKIALTVLRKLKPEDRQEVKDETKAIIADPRKKPSKILDTKGKRALLVGVIGVGVCAALIGTGLVDPSFVAFVGVKALDFGIDKVRSTLAASAIDEFFVAAVVGNFIMSKDGGGFFEKLSGTIKDTANKFLGNKPDDKDDSETNEEEKSNDNRPASDADGVSNPSQEESAPEPDSTESADLKRPTPERLKKLEDALKTANIQATVSKRATKPGELQQSVVLSFNPSEGDAVRKVMAAEGMVSTHKFAPFISITTKDLFKTGNVSGYFSR